jgi:hypothetical protein
MYATDSLLDDFITELLLCSLHGVHNNLGGGHICPQVSPQSYLTVVDFSYLMWGEVCTKLLSAELVSISVSPLYSLHYTHMET